MSRRARNRSQIHKPLAQDSKSTQGNQVVGREGDRPRGEDEEFDYEEYDNPAPELGFAQELEANQEDEEDEGYEAEDQYQEPLPPRVRAAASPPRAPSSARPAQRNQ